MEEYERRSESTRPLRWTMRALYGMVIILPCGFAVLALPDNLVGDTYTIFFQFLVGGPLIGSTINMAMLAGKGKDFRKQYEAIGDAALKMPPQDLFKPVATAAALTVTKWHRRYLGVVLLSAALLFTSGMMFWVSLAGVLLTKTYFIASIVPLLIGVDLQLSAVYYHSLIEFVIW